MLPAIRVLLLYFLKLALVFFSSGTVMHAADR
jgi:hypothetical protein